MKSRGRKGLAEVLSLHQSVPGTAPAPPIELTEAEAALWRVIVSTKPWDWFTQDTFPLLKEYCRASIQLDDMAEQIRLNGMPTDKPSASIYKLVSERQDKLRTAIKVLAASLRISLQARYDAQKAGTKGRAQPLRKPWERANPA